MYIHILPLSSTCPDALLFVFLVVVVALSVSHLVINTYFFSVTTTLLQAVHPKLLNENGTRTFVQKDTFIHLYMLTRKILQLKELAQNSEFSKDFKMGLCHLPYSLF